MSRTGALLALAILLAACGNAATSSGSVDPSASSGGSDGPLESPSSRANEATPSPSVVEAPTGLEVDGLARAAVAGLAVRSEPTTTAERIAVLREGERLLVVDGPVDAEGYLWYRVAPAEEAPEACGTPDRTDAFACAAELGWSVATTSENDAWLEAVDPGCPTTRDTETYIALDPVVRLACAGDDQWELVAFLAPETGGRGCFPVWLTDPGWLDGSCNFFFPQPDESQFDDDTRLQAFIPPDLGSCTVDGCPFDALRGSWVRILGHLDDPAARTCTSVLSSAIDQAPYGPPDSDRTILDCRLRFVVTSVTATAAP